MGENGAPEMRRQILFAIVCAILLLVGTTIQQAHFHADGLTHTDCAICHTAHQVVQPSVQCAVQQAAVPTTQVVLLSVRLLREHRFSFSHWNRPPPDQTATA
jgi:hypothetical protein